MKNPYVDGTSTRLKLVLPCSRKRAWELMGTSKGLGLWFPQAGCSGEIKTGEEIVFNWGKKSRDRFTVLDVKKEHFWEMSWFSKVNKVRYELSEQKKALVLTLTVLYPKTQKGKDYQLLELPCWAFFLANLKSIAMGGPDLRDNSGLTWQQGFID